MRRISQSRSGVAAVEAAICLPVLALIIFGAVEISAGIFQEYNAQSCAYELSKVALEAKTDCTDVQTLAASLIPQFGFENYDITIEVIPRTVNTASVDPPLITLFTIPSTGSVTSGLDELPRGTLLQLTLSADRPDTVTNFFRATLGEQISTQCVFCKEF